MQVIDTHMEIDDLEVIVILQFNFSSLLFYLCLKKKTLLLLVQFAYSHRVMVIEQ